MRKIKLFVYRVNKHYSLSDLNIPKSQYLDLIEAAYKPSIMYQHYLHHDFFEVVGDHEAADFIIFPLNLSSLIYRSGIFGDYKSFSDINDPDGNQKVLSFLYKLPYFNTHQEKHLLLSAHDWDGPYDVSCIVAGNCMSKYSGVRHISLPFEVKDIGCREDKTGIRYFTNFLGYYGSHQSRLELANSLVSFVNSGGEDLSICLQFNDRFYPRLPEEDREKKRTEFLDVMNESLTTLCPRGSGFNSIRFFETMCMGRVPILISDGCELPLEGEIDWDSLILRIDEGDIADIGPILEEFSVRYDPNRLWKMGIKNRIVWETYPAAVNDSQDILYLPVKVPRGNVRVGRKAPRHKAFEHELARRRDFFDEMTHWLIYFAGDGIL